MKLAALGVVTVGIGVALAIPGLVGIGAFWVVMGFLARAHARRIEGLRAEAGAGGSDATATPAATPTPAVDARTFALGTLLWLVLGAPSLAVGLLEIGIGAGDEDWRWLPIIVGGLALGVGVLGAVMYIAGSAALAVAGGGGQPQLPATLRIRAVRETGTFVNERPRLEFDFLVEPDATTGLAAYEVTKKATVPFTAIAALRVGDGFRALVAGPEDPTSMEIQWDQPVADDAAQPDVSSRLAELDRLHREAKITDEEYHAQRQRILGTL